MLNAYPFDAVLFDLDGVIIDTTELHYSVWREFAEARGIACSREMLLATNGRKASETICRVNERLASEPVPAVQGVVEFVKRLAAKQIPRAVATSAVPKNATLSLVRVGLQGYFDAMVTAADVKHGKPHPEPYLKAAQALGVSPERCLVVEDSVAGIRAAHAAGAKCLALATTFSKETLEAEHPEWLIPDLRAVPAHLWPH
jgi:beta-phosphoglucomutase